MIRRFLSSQLRLNMVSGVLVHAINTVVLVATYPLYLHFLGKETYGLWLTLSVVPTLVQLGDFGISQAVTKLVAEEHGKGNPRAAGQYVAMALLMLLLSGLIGLLALVAFRRPIVELLGLKGANADMAMWLLPLIGLLSVYALIVNAFNATLAGFGRMDLANYVQAGGRIVSLGVALVFLSTGHALGSLVMGVLSANIVTHAATVICIRLTAPVRFISRNSWNIARARRLLTFGSAIFGGSLINMLMDPLNRIVLSRFAGPGSVVIYDIASRGCQQIRAVLVMALRAMMPEISRLSTQDPTQSYAAVRRLHHRTQRFVVLVGSAGFGALCATAPWLLRIWLRSEFTDDMPRSFQVMAVAVYVSLLGVPAYFTLMGLNQVRLTFVSHLLQALLSAISVCIIIVSPLEISPFAVCISLLVGFLGSTIYLLVMMSQRFRQMKDIAGNVQVLPQASP